MSLVDVAVAAFGTVAVLAGILVVTTRHVVRAALWLVVSLGGVAACFLAMAAEFLAWLQVLIYVGAVVVIVLFGLMLTHAPIGPSDDLTTNNRRLASGVAVATGGGLAALFASNYGDVVVDLSGAQSVGGEAIGRAVFSTWILPFEALSVLLLAALVGAISVSRTRSSDRGH